MRNIKSNKNTMLPFVSDMMEHHTNLLQPNRITPCLLSNNNEIANIGINYETLLNSLFTIDEIKNAIKSIKHRNLQV